MRALKLLPLLLLVPMIAACSVQTQIDPQNTGLLVDYKTGEISVQPGGKWVWWDNWNQNLIQYPAGERTLTMVASEKEGQVVGNDATLCNVKGGSAITYDSSTIWQFETSKVADVYRAHPGIPVDGDDINKTITGTVVRPAVRSAFNLVCPDYDFTQAVGEKKGEIQERLKQLIADSLDDEHIQVKEFFLRGSHLTPEQQKAIQTVLDAQQAALAAQSDKAKAEAVAAGKIAQAQGEAEANRILAESLSDRVLQSKALEKWDGHLPQVSGAGATPLLPLGTPIPSK